MIITITGKPCSGKGTASKEFCKKYNFEYISTGDMNRKLAKSYGYSNVLEFQKSKYIKEVDKIIDGKLVEIGKTRANEDIIIDSRLAWHFIPNSFKVFIDIDDKTAGERLLTSNRDTEKVSSLTEAMENLKNRWKTENERYQKLYNINNLNLKNYDFVINSKDLTPEQIVEEINKNYQIFLKKL